MTRAEKAERRNTIAKLYSEGVSVDELTKRFQLGKYYIRNIIGVRNESSIDVLRKHSGEVKTLFDAGKSHSDIGKIFGVSKSVVGEFCKENGMLRGSNANSEEDVARKIRDKSNGSLEYISGYTIKEKPVRVRCLVCGGEFERTFHNITTKGGVTCPHCVERERLQLKEARDADKERKRKEREAKAIERKAEEERKRAERKHPCPVCGETTIRNKYCSVDCAKKADNKRRDFNRRVKLMSAMVDKDITVEGLYRRDGGTCYLCGRKCNLEDYTIRDGAFIVGDWYPSIDHVIPLVKGGLHSWDNVMLAHHRCNSEKSDKTISPYLQANDAQP